MVLQFYFYLETKHNTVALKSDISYVVVQTEPHFLIPSPSLRSAHVTEPVPHPTHFIHEDAGSRFLRNSVSTTGLRGVTICTSAFPEYFYPTFLI
jgi:hypothetical protein